MFPWGQLVTPRQANEALPEDIRRCLRGSMHAKARRIELDVNSNQQHVMVAVKDEGGEFDIEPTLTKGGEQRNLGIMGMRERAHLLSGSLDVRSSPDSGTEMIAGIPNRGSDK
jgi:two-component system sensor histidine kinase UhpB